MISVDKTLWRSLSPLLDIALDLETAAQRDLIADLRRDSPALADVLTELLADCERIRVHPFLETPAEVAADSPTSVAGHRAGGYTLVRPIGAGGMGADGRAAATAGSRGRRQSSC